MSKELQKSESTGKNVSLMQEGGFQKIWSIAACYAKSEIVPDKYREKPENCLVAINLAESMGLDHLTVMQNLDIIKGKPSWSSKFITSRINASGKYTPIRWKVTKTGVNLKGVEYMDYKTLKKFPTDLENIEFIAIAKDLSTGEVLESPTVSIEMAIKEGWYTKLGSKWQTMPELMGRYRSASMFGSLYCPELINGIQSSDEVIDAEYVVMSPEVEAEEIVTQEANTEEFNPESQGQPAEPEEIATSSDDESMQNQASGEEPKLDF